MGKSMMKQTVRDEQGRNAAGLLAGRPQLSLAGWYANIIAPQQAAVLLAAAQSQWQVRLCAGRSGFGPRLQQLICHFWLGGGIDLEYASLAAAAGNDCERALLELVCGQLLISGKLRRALPHLQAGFSLAAEYLEAADYFHLVRRHELLRYIALRETPAPARNLEALLAEAAVIERLRVGEGRRDGHTHHDTVG
jgi:hypothetical protein